MMKLDSHKLAVHEDNSINGVLTDRGGRDHLCPELEEEH